VTALVVGMSYKTAPVPVLERLALSGDELGKTLDELRRCESVSEVLLLSTCNRLEVYADVARFHPAVTEITSVLSRHSGLPM
jgi:glutamyl-tRNA reductase